MKTKNQISLFITVLLVVFLTFSGSGCETKEGLTQLKSYTGGNVNLPNSPYGYETWDFSNGSNSPNKFYWYGPDERGGGAYRAEWGGYFLARLGFFWGNGQKYTNYKNIYIDYDYTRGGNSPGGFIGMYGWSRNPSASKAEEKLIEFYIVDDWFYSGQLGINQIKAGGQTPDSAKELGSFEADGAVYKIYTNLRTQQPSIDGTKTFIQLFSVRQGETVKQGTISVTEHFKEWSKYIELGNLYEVKHKVETFGGSGWLDCTYLYLSMEDEAR